MDLPSLERDRIHCAPADSQAQQTSMFPARVQRSGVGKRHATINSGSEAIPPAR